MEDGEKLDGAGGADEAKKEGKEKEKKFIFLETLGKGAFGKVRLAEHVLTGMRIAIKILDKEKIAKKNDEITIQREIQILSALHHPNIIQLYEVRAEIDHKIIENPKHYFFVTEVAPKGELSAYIKLKGKLPTDECLKYFRQLISALRYMHSKNISHRDIKPPNILLNIYY